MARAQREADQPATRQAGKFTADASEFPAVNIWTGDDKAVLTAEIPGVDPEVIELTVRNDTITIRGTRDAETAKDGEAYLRHERGSGRFVRSFALPFSVESEDVSAEYKNGVLQVALPRAEADKPKRVTIAAG
jgi:HSP20 family protein